MSDAEALAVLHAQAMADRPWTAAEFAGLLDAPGVFVIGAPPCFALGRVAADEAELLTIATHLDQRRQGLARAVLAEFRALARTRGARQAFLEVAADNRAAQALYAADGWRESGRRRGYYPRETGAVDALVLSCDLTGP